MDQQPVPQLLSETEVADMLGVSVGTLRRYRHNGEIGFLKLGRRRWHTPTHLAEFVARRTFSAVMPAAPAE